jgi:hypothetical protein
LAFLFAKLPCKEGDLVFLLAKISFILGSYNTDTLACRACPAFGSLIPFYLFFEKFFRVIIAKFRKSML